MASANYYNDPAENRSRPSQYDYDQNYVSSQNTSYPPSSSANFYQSYNQSPSLYLGSNSNDGVYQSRQPSQLSINEHYSDTIPLKSPIHNIQTFPPTPDWRNQNSTYPPSPESQGQKLLPEPPRRKGFFNGKIPWVVYTVTTIQVAVFIVEIVKNGE